MPISAIFHVHCPQVPLLGVCGRWRNGVVLSRRVPHVSLVRGRYHQARRCPQKPRAQVSHPGFLAEAAPSGPRAPGFRMSAPASAPLITLMLFLEPALIARAARPRGRTASTGEERRGGKGERRDTPQSPKAANILLIRLKRVHLSLSLWTEN